MAAGLLTAALAVAAHAMAGGAVPPGAAVVLLTVLAVTVGAVAATTDRTADTPALLALLAVGQLSAHVVLTAAGHTHCAAPPAGPPAAAMLAAHTVALVVGAALIAASDRLCRAVSSAMRAFVRELPRTLATGAAAAVTAGDQPLRSVLLLAASVSHRGPPVSPAR